MENFPEGEISEMVDLYCGRGMSRADAEQGIGTMAKYPKLFVENMMVDEEVVYYTTSSRGCRTALPKRQAARTIDFLPRLLRGQRKTKPAVQETRPQPT